MSYRTYLQNPTELMFEMLPPELQVLFRTLRLDGYEVDIVDTGGNVMCLSLWTDDDLIISIFRDAEYEYVYAVVVEKYTSNVTWPKAVDEQYFNTEEDCIDYLKALGAEPGC